ncbi:hypothetical protein G7Y89_g15156 [Cudoniella acicularis]|uniref:Uncharacterized protein n=1 Tax=Cudoniella acicularis TaxID=354080 RepID=A0A8H4QRT8_9HELO|nr:hypothetical protein G7Y89_g15156 [Cudoniella acicularis]
MSSAQAQRIDDYCKIIWGSDSEYDIDFETDDYIHYHAVVKKDYGLSFGSPLTITSLCPSMEAASRELNRMLSLWAAQVRSGKPMTNEQKLEIFGGSRGEHKSVLEQFNAELEKRKTNSDAKQT